MYFLTNLDELLRVHDLNRNQFCMNVGIAPSTMHSWYSKGYENISLKTLNKVSTYFNISIDDLVNNDLRTNPHLNLVFSSKDYDENELKAIKNFVKVLDEYKEHIYKPFHHHGQRLDGLKIATCRICGNKELVVSEYDITTIPKCGRCKRLERNKK